MNTCTVLPGGLSSTPLEPASEVSPSQFDSINDEHTPVLQTPPPSSSSSPPTTLSPDTSCANSKTIPLASEIKEAVNQGVKVANEVQPATPESSSVVSGKKMNPDAPTFVPGNSPTSGVSPSLPGKHPPVSSEQGNSMSELNPNVKEFVPSGKSSMLNVAAADFVPSPRLLIVENGDPDQFYPPVEEIDFDPLQKDVGTTELAMQDPKYLTEWFYKPGSVLESDIGYENLLEYCAEILVKATLYPDSFENRQQILQNMMSSRQLSEGAYTNLAEMLIHWVRAFYTFIHLHVHVHVCDLLHTTVKPVYNGHCVSRSPLYNSQVTESQMGLQCAFQPALTGHLSITASFFGSQG